MPAGVHLDPFEAHGGPLLRQRIGLLNEVEILNLARLPPPAVSRPARCPLGQRLDTQLRVGVDDMRPVVVTHLLRGRWAALGLGG